MTRNEMLLRSARSVGRSAGHQSVAWLDSYSVPKETQSTTTRGRGVFTTCEKDIDNLLPGPFFVVGGIHFDYPTKKVCLSKRKKQVA